MSLESALCRLNRSSVSICDLYHERGPITEQHAHRSVCHCGRGPQTSRCALRSTEQLGASTLLLPTSTVARHESKDSVNGPRPPRDGRHCHNVLPGAPTPDMSCWVCDTHKRRLLCPSCFRFATSSRRSDVSAFEQERDTQLAKVTGVLACKVRVQAYLCRGGGELLLPDDRALKRRLHPARKPPLPQDRKAGHVLLLAQLASEAAALHSAVLDARRQLAALQARSQQLESASRRRRTELVCARQQVGLLPPSSALPPLACSRAVEPPSLPRGARLAVCLQLEAWQRRAAAEQGSLVEAPRRALTSVSSQLEAAQACRCAPRRRGGGGGSGWAAAAAQWGAAAVAADRFRLPPAAPVQHDTPAGRAACQGPG